MPIQHIELTQRASDYPEALWSTKDGTPPIWRVLLWPHRSLPRGGFVIFIAATSVMLAIPVLPLIGTSALWGLLPFLVLTVAGLWFFLMRNYRDGHMIEELSLWPDMITLVRLNPRGTEAQRRQDWSANPYWVKVSSHEKPVAHYLTLSGGSRDVELGTFLTPDERKELHATLDEQLRALRQKSDR